VKAHEPLAWQLLSLHNIHFMCQLAASLREGILADRV
jgi:queuine/archaeosine tRNA-ribosyltransferase